MDFDFDLFFFWRRILVTACMIYAAIRLAQSGYGWYRWFAGTQRYMPVVRSYALLQLVRISPRRFGWQLVDIVILLAVLLAVVALHVPAA